MAETLGASRLRLGLVDWAEAANNPNTLPEAGAVGSFYLRQGNGGTSPTESYLRLNAGATGWVKQNTINLTVYNVKTFGAIGDGVVNDRAAIIAAYTAANAAGGGIVYFPPGSYRVQDRTTALASFELENVHNITFLGDGFASKVLMDGDGTNADWYLFYMHDGTSQIKFVNLYMDGAAIINPDPGEQTHMIFSASEAADTLGGAHDIDVIDCYLGTVDGDGVRTLGGNGGPVEDVRVRRTIFNMPSCRCGVAVQRRTHRLDVVDCFFTGSDDQNIDFEPSGGGTTAIEDCLVTGCMVLATVIGNIATFVGNSAAQPIRRTVVAYNQFRDGGDIQVLDGERVKIHGNINIEAAGGLGSTSIGIVLNDSNIEVQVTSNVCDAPGSLGVFRICQITTGNNTRERNLIADNVGKTYGDAGGGVGILSNNGNDTTIDGNVLEMSDATVNVANGIQIGSINAIIDGGQVHGNMIISTNANMLAGIQFAAQAFAMGLCQANFNFVRGAGSGVRLIASGGGSFADWRGATGNNAPGITGSIVAISGFTSGVTIEGNAGPSSRIVQGGATPVANVPSPVGSIGLNTAGGEGAVFFYKETAATPVDTASWIPNGPGGLLFAAEDLTATQTALFMATGMDLATAIATEIQAPAVRLGTLREIRLDCIAGVGAGTVTFTTRINGVNTALALAVLNTAITGVATAAVALAAGDLVSMQVTKSAAPGTPQTFVAIALEISG